MNNHRESHITKKLPDVEYDTTYDFPKWINFKREFSIVSRILFQDDDNEHDKNSDDLN